jgi:hypothetical protein
MRHTLGAALKRNLDQTRIMTMQAAQQVDGVGDVAA